MIDQIREYINELPPEDRKLYNEKLDAKLAIRDERAKGEKEKQDTSDKNHKELAALLSELRELNKVSLQSAEDQSKKTSKDITELTEAIKEGNKLLEKQSEYINNIKIPQPEKEVTVTNLKDIKQRKSVAVSELPTIRQPQWYKKPFVELQDALGGMLGRILDVNVKNDVLPVRVTNPVEPKVVMKGGGGGVIPFQTSDNNARKALVDGNGMLFNRDFAHDIAMGLVPNYSYIHKFGRNINITSTLSPVCDSGFYRTPTSAQTLEIVSSSAADNTGSSGAYSVYVEGLDSTGAIQSESINLNGLSAVALANPYLRVYRMYVDSSGYYATQSASSQVGTITLRGSSAGNTWATIPTIVSGFGGGQSFIGAYTVPLNYTAHIMQQEFSSDISGTKTTDFYFFKRENILDVTSPYSGVMRVQNVKEGTQGLHTTPHQTYESYPELTDIGFIAKASATTTASVEFELLLIEN